MKKIDRMASRAGIDIFGLGTDRVKWNRSLEAYTQLIVEECINKFGQTRTEPNLSKYIMDGLKDENS
jgi:hypothetical protein